ncbi:hypothetical protein L7F22_030231 [Adiantum nelumboides]|nr:hypothetical protein [Adiantum nelumboides]
MGLLGLAKKMPASPPACVPALASSPSPCFIPGLKRGICFPAPLAGGARERDWGRAAKRWQSRRLSIVMKAVENQGKVKGEDVSDNKILQYCSIDKKTDKRSLGELEAEFLEALQSFYYDKKPIMSNEEFDNLKEELIWEGSSVVILSSDEQRFMEASMAYAAGKPNITDADYDALKLKLKKSGSKVAIEGPRCSLRSKKVS